MGFSLRAFFGGGAPRPPQTSASPAKAPAALPASPVKAPASPRTGAPASPQRAHPLRPLAALVEEGSALCARLASGAVIALPDGGEGPASVIAPLAYARRVSPTLLMAAAPPSSPIIDCVTFAADALECAVPFFNAAPFLRHGMPLLALFSAACGAALREGVALVALEDGGSMVVRFPRSVPPRLQQRGSSAEVSVLRRVAAALFDHDGALGAEVAVVGAAGGRTRVRFATAIVVRDINLQNLRELLRGGGAEFPARAVPAPPAPAPATAPAAAGALGGAAMDAEAGVVALPAEHALAGMRSPAAVQFPVVLGVEDAALGGLLRGAQAGGARLVGATDPAASLAGVIARGYNDLLDGGKVFVPLHALPAGAAPILAALAPAAATGAAPPPNIADEMLAAQLAAAPALPGADDERAGFALRRATAEEVVKAARGLPPRALGGSPALLPVTLYYNGYSASVAAAVQLNSQTVPPAIALDLGGLDGDVETPNADADVDGCFVAGWRASARLLALNKEELARTQPVRHTRPPLSPTAFALRTQLAASVGTAAALRAGATAAGDGGELFEPPFVPATAFSPAAALRRVNARPSDLALANAADALDRNPPTSAALAVVGLVNAAAARVGYNGCGLSVSMPCSGYPAICTESFTPDHSFRGSQQPLRLPCTTDTSAEPLVVCVTGWGSGVVAQAMREVATAIAYLGASGSTGSAMWALWYAGAATGAARQLPGGACVPLSVLLHLLCNFPALPGPSFWIQTYNQKARGAVVALPDALGDFSKGAAAVAGATLEQALRRNNSAVPLLYQLFAGDPQAALLSFGVGVAVNSVLRDGKLVHANVRLDVSGGDLFVGPGGGEPLFKGGFVPVQHFLPFGCPVALAPCTARRTTSSVLEDAAARGAADPGTALPVAYVQQGYSRAMRYCAGASLFMKAGDLAGATTVGLDNVPTLDRRVLFEASKAAAACASTFLTQLAATGPLPRLDAVWAAGHSGTDVTLAAALGASLEQSVGLFRRGLVTASLDDAVTYMGSGCTSLFAAYTASLRALGDSSLAPMDALATSAFAACLAGLLRLLPKGRHAGHGALQARACTALGINQVNALPPLPPCVAAVLGCAPQADVAFEQLTLGGGDGIAEAAAKQASAIAARLAAESTPFICAHSDAGGATCGATFSTANGLFSHLNLFGHRAPPTGPDGAYVKTTLSNRALALRAVDKLSHTQKVVVCSALSTGRSIVLGGPGGHRQDGHHAVLCGCL